MRFSRLLLAYVCWASVAFGYTPRAGGDLSLLTSAEQSAAMAPFGLTSSAKPNAYLDTIEGTVRAANRGANAQSLRVPVSTPRLYGLQARLAAQGRFVPMSELKPAVDVGQTLLRETPDATLANKAARYAEVQRKPMHGAVAEYAEARARGMVLTKSRVSEAYDLTEPKVRPRNAQMKIYGNEMKAIDDIEDDLLKAGGKRRLGILPKSTIQKGVAAGRIIETPEGYRSAKSSQIIFEESKVFSRPAESRLYTQAGRESLLTRSAVGAEGAATAGETRFRTTTKWLGRAGLVAIAGLEVYSVRQYYSGNISEREFLTTQAGLAGGSAGAWAGAKAGAAAGAYIGAALTPEAVGAGAIPGALIGGLIGGFGGGYVGTKLGEGALDHYYNRLDAEQNTQLRQFVYAFYNVSR